MAEERRRLYPRPWNSDGDPACPEPVADWVDGALPVCWTVRLDEDCVFEEVILRDDRCRFRARCPLADEQCLEQPPFTEIAPGHRVACWKVG